MIKTTKESVYLHRLAHWFRKVDEHGLLLEGQTDCQEVARFLGLIADKLALLEDSHRIVNSKLG